MACLRSLLASAAIAATAAWRGSSVKSSKVFLANQADLRPDVVASSFASLADKWRSQARVFAECNASLDSSVVDDAASLPPCSGGPRAFERSCSTVAGAVLKASDGKPDVVSEYMGEVCGESKLTGWKTTTCRGFSKALLDAMSADVLSNRERVRAKAVCHGFWSRFLAQESELFEVERKEREEASRQKAAKRAEAMKRAAEEAAERAEEEAKAGEERRRKEEEARREAQKKRVEGEEAARQAAKEAEAASAAHLMEEARALANVSSSATQVPENASVSSPQEVLTASAEALATNGPVPSQEQTAPAAADMASDANTSAAAPNNSSVPAAANLERTTSSAAGAMDGRPSNATSQEQVLPAAANATDGLAGNATNHEQVAPVAANTEDGLPGNGTGQERITPAAANATDGSSGNATSASTAGGKVMVLDAAVVNKTV